jgi:hypothetical protein
MKIITVINDEKDPYFNLLRLSCATNGLKLVTLVANRTDFSSRRIKDELLFDYLLDENNDELILFTDGTDAVFMADEKEILSKFADFESDLVFSTEMGCFPDPGMASRYSIDQNTPYNYLNSGGFIGKAGLILELLREKHIDENKAFSWSNQYLWTKRYLNNTHRIKLDTCCSLFFTLYTPQGQQYYPHNKKESYLLKREWFDRCVLIQGHRLKNQITGTWPCQAHFNGSAKMLMDERITQMVYSALPQYSAPEFYYEK